MKRHVALILAGILAICNVGGVLAEEELIVEDDILLGEESPDYEMEEVFDELIPDDKLISVESEDDNEFIVESVQEELDSNDSFDVDDIRKAKTEDDLYNDYELIDDSINEQGEIIEEDIYPVKVGASAPSGILGNGTDGIVIDINSAPYTTFASYSYGEYAYGGEGCAWFASARVNQLTGKGSTIFSGWAWYFSQYPNYGFSIGSEPRAKALACYGNHVAVVEAVSGDTITVSQGGMGGLSDSAHGYCIISQMSRYQLEHQGGCGEFYGYVYLDGAEPSSSSFYYSSPGVNPYGSLDAVEGGDGTLYIKGWALDRNSDEPLAIHVYVGGSASSGQAIWSTSTVVANKYRPDVNTAFPGAGDYHGFEETFTVPFTGTYDVYVYAINVGGRGTSTNYNPLLDGAPKQVTISEENFSYNVYGMIFGYEGYILYNDLTGLCTFDVYINGNKVADDVSSYHANLPVGTIYEITDARVTEGYGLHSSGGYITTGRIVDMDMSTYIGITRDDYTITYETDEGSPCPEPQTKLHGLNIGLTTIIPEKPLYHFVGWKADNGIVYAPGEMYTHNKDVILTAVWEKNDEVHSVKFVANGGSRGDSEELVVDGESVVLYYAGTKDGFWFAGWSLDPSGSSELYCYSPSTPRYGPVYEDMTFYAIWKNTVTLEFDGNGGTGIPESIVDSYGATLTIPDTVPIREGYTFVGWNDYQREYEIVPGVSYSAQYDPGESVTLYGDRVLYAFWRPITYYVYYTGAIYEGGKYPQTQIKEHGKPLVLSTEIPPSRMGYSFQGWSTKDLSSTVDYEPGAIYTENKVVWLHAVWKRDTYTITYNANGGTDTLVPQTKEYEKDIRLSTQIPNRSGYTFLGWATSPDAVEPQFAAGEIYKENGDVTLYAVWKVNAESAITLYPDSVSLESGKSQAITVSGLATGDSVRSWSSANTGIATIDRSGIITAVKCGETIVTVTLESGLTIDVYVKVQHTVVIDNAVPASCTKTGMTEGAHCLVCGEVIVAQWEVPKTVHTVVADAAVAETCVEAGKTEGSHCSVCGTVLTAQKAIPAKGHIVVKDAAVAATCTEAGKTEGSHCSVCGTVLTVQKEVTATGHKWDGGKMTKYATASATGVKTYICSICGETKTESIPQLTAKEAEGDEKDPTSVAGTEKAISAVKDNGEPKGSRFSKIQLQSAKQTKNSITLSWNKVKDADGYILFGNKCGPKTKLERIKKITSNKYVYKKLKKGTYYKFTVSAYKIVEGKEQVIGTSKVVHVATLGGKVTNVKKVTASVKKKAVKSVTLKVKKSVTITAKETLQNKKLSLKSHRKVKFESSNTKIATVNSKGKVTAKKKGTCYIYVYSQDGVYTRIKVTVK